MRLLPLILLIASLPAFHVSAQTADILLSPIDSGFRMLPGAEVERVSTTDGNVVVVWGTTETDSFPALLSAYYVQIIRNGSPVGIPQRVGGPRAHVGNGVRVAATGDDAIVFFFGSLDGESKPRIYSQFLSGRTLELDTPRIIRNGSSFDIAGNRDRAIVTGNRTTGWRVFLHDVETDALLAARFDSVGRVERPLEYVGRMGSELLRYGAFPEHFLLIAPNNDWKPLLVASATGEIEARGAVALDCPYHIADDGTVLTMRGSRIDEFGSIMDSIPRRGRTLTLDAWRIGWQAGHGRPDPPALIERRDDGGVDVTLILPRRSDPSARRGVSVLVVLLRLDSLNGPVSIDTLLEHTAPATDRQLYPQMVLQRPGCWNQFELQLAFTEQVFTDERLWVTRDTSGGISVSAQSASISCGASSDVLIERLDEPRRSAVRVGPNGVVLTVPTAQLSPPRHSVPALVVTGRRLLCLWQEHDTTVRHGVRQWYLATDSLGDIAYFTPPQPVSQKVGEISQEPGTLTTQRECVPMMGDAVLNYQEEFYASYTYYRGRNEPPGSSVGMNTQTYLVRPTVDGWRIVDDRLGATPWGSDPWCWRGRVLGNDPANGTVLALLTWGDFRPGISIAKRHVVAAYSREGPLWEYMVDQSPIARGAAVLLDGRRVLSVVGGQATVYDSSEVVGRFTVDTLSARRTYAGLLGPNWVRTSWLSGVGDTLRVEIYHDDGRKRVDVRLPRPDTSGDFSLAQMRADSSIVIVFGGAGGVRATRIALNGSILSADERVSAWSGAVRSPRAAFIGDTLAVAWVDERLDVPRVFGTLRKLPIVAGTDLSHRTSDALELRPNPASTVVDALSGHMQGELVLELADMYGRILIREPYDGYDGGGAHRLDLTSLPSGPYMVRVRSRQRTSQAILVKR